jgi:hypothetical protein
MTLLNIKQHWPHAYHVLMARLFNECILVQATAAFFHTLQKSYLLTITLSGIDIGSKAQAMISGIDLDGMAMSI